MSETKTNPMPTAMKGLTLTRFRPLSKPGSAIRGFASFEYGSIGVNDAPVLQSNGKVWINLPGKPRIDRDGNPMLDHRGKPAYDAINFWVSREGGDKIQSALLTVIRDQFPDALE